MSRKRKYLIGKEFKDERTFSKFIDTTSNYYNRSELLDPTAVEFYTEAVKHLPYRSTWGSQKYLDVSDTALGKLNNQFLKQHRPNIPESLYAGLNHSSSYGTSLTDEGTKFGTFMLNEFLAQDEFDRYGDFLDAKWDDLFDDATCTRLNVYPHTAMVYAHNDLDSPYVFRKGVTKKNQKILEDITRDQFMTLLSEKAVRVDAKSVPLFLTNKLKELNGTVERQMSDREATNQLLRAFSVSLLAGGLHSKLELPEVYAAITEIVKEIRGGRVARDSINYTVNQITPNRLGKIGQFLEDNGADFTVGEMFFVIYTIHTPRLFARIGALSEVAALFEKFLEKENALELFKMVGELAQGYELKLPTIKQWEKCFEEGTLDTILDSSLTAEIVSLTDEPAPRTYTVNTRRSMFGSKL